MIHVVLDTSIYRADMGRRGKAFKALERLALSKKATLHVPYFVEYEALSHYASVYDEPLATVARGVKELLKKGLTDGARKEFEQFRDAIEKNQNTLPALESKRFASWLKNVKAKKHRIRARHGRTVASDYFAGSLPFERQKSRDDIPDAFIFQSILDLASKHKHLHVVVADGRLYEACAGKAGMLVHKSLKEFISSPKCSEALIEQNLEDNVRILMKMLSEQPTLVAPDMENLLLDALPYTTVTDSGIPDDNNEGLITTVDEVRELEFEPTAISYLGDGEFALPFSLEVDVSIDYFLYHSEFQFMDDDRAEKLSVLSHPNDHYLEVQEEVTLEMDGTLVVTIEMDKLSVETLSDHECEELLKDADLSIDPEMHLGLWESLAM